MYRVFQALDDLIAMIEEARNIPMTNNCVVPRQDSLLLLDEIRDAFPGELDDAQDVLDQRDSILAEAEAKARELVGNAQAEANQTLTDARAESEGMVADANTQANKLVVDAQERSDAMMLTAETEAAATVDSAQRQAEDTTSRARAEAERTVDDAEALYDRMLTEARSEQQRMVSESEVSRVADEEARRVREDAYAEASRRRDECDDYVEQKMAEFEDVLATTIRTVQRGRAEMAGGYAYVRDNYDDPGAGDDRGYRDERVRR